MTDDELLSDLRAVSAKLGGETLSRPQYDEHGTFNGRTVERRFGGWRVACAKAGLKTNTAGVKPDAPMIGEPPSKHIGTSFDSFLDESGDRGAVDRGARMDPVIEKPRPVEYRSRTVLFTSDIHFNTHCPRFWAAVREFHAWLRPWKTIIGGDFVDLESLSSYAKSQDTDPLAIPEIRTFVGEANAMAGECGELIVIEGNHDERYVKALFGDKAMAFRDALGLTLHDQALRQGLDPTIRWFRETVENPVLPIAQFDVSHGHNAVGRFGGGKHLAANAIAKTMGRSSLRGHSHRAQLFAQTYGDHTAIAVQNGCAQKRRPYAKQNDWQYSITLLELDAPDYTRATPHLIIAEKGRFSYGGRTFGVAA